jgi:hypothetical protein
MQLKHYLAMWQRQLKSGSDDLALNRYTEFVHYHYENALKKMYRRFTVEFNVDWEEVAKDYYNQYPPESYELNRLTYSFPEFVEQNLKKYVNKDYIRTNKIIIQTM